LEISIRIKFKLTLYNRDFINFKKNQIFLILFRREEIEEVFKSGHRMLLAYRTIAFFYQSIYPRNKKSFGFAFLFYHCFHAIKIGNMA